VVRLFPLSALAVLLAALFAGCFGASQPPALPASAGTSAASLGAFHPSGAAVTADEVQGIIPLQGEERFTGATSFEPTLGVDPKGAVYMAARYEGTIGERVRASFDQGLTWADVEPTFAPGVTNPPESSDPFIYVDPVTGRVFEAMLQGEACSWMVFSDDQGKTWTTNPADCGLPFTGDDHQSVVAAPSRDGTATTYGNGRMVYYCSQNNVLLNCASSTDGGFTFGVRTPVVIKVQDSELPAACEAASGHVRSDHAGRVFLTQVHCGTPVIVVSEDEGKSWTTHVISDAVKGRGYHMDLAADSADNLYALWISDKGQPEMAVSIDHGVSWSTPVRMSAPAVTATIFPVIEAGGVGRVVAGFYGSEHPGAPDGAQDATWNAYLVVTMDALSADPVVVSTTANPPADPLNRGDCSGRCAGAGDFLDIALDPDGRPWMALTDVCVEACVTGTANDAGADHGAVGTLASGPSLLDGRSLPGLR
jgi:hypothetical protein